MSVERVGDVTCETVRYAGGTVRHFPFLGETYWAMYDTAPGSQHVTVYGSAFGVLVDERASGYGAGVYSTRERAEAAQAALPDNAHGKRLTIGLVRWHAGSVFTRA